ncbi:YdcF family protein [Verrucomicrobiota bacterium sgz303538]
MKRTRLRRYLWIALLAGAAVLAIAVGALVWDGLSDEIGTADLGLVLGNTVYPDGTPSPRLAARLDRALELYRQGTFPLILVSGARGKEGHDEASVMRDYLVSRGVPSTHVLVDSAGYTTFATAKNTHTLMNQRQLRSVLVVSQYFHVPRAKLALMRFGIPTVYSAHARFFEARDLYSIPRELVGFLRYAVRAYDRQA